VRSLQSWIRTKYRSEELEAALEATLGDRRFGESTKRLVVPAYSLGDDDVYVFRTPHAKHLPAQGALVPTPAAAQLAIG
jgi:uncharacterized protein